MNKQRKRSLPRRLRSDKKKKKKQGAQEIGVMESKKVFPESKANVIRRQMLQTPKNQKESAETLSSEKAFTPLCPRAWNSAWCRVGP